MANEDESTTARSAKAERAAIVADLTNSADLLDRQYEESKVEAYRERARECRYQAGRFQEGRHHAVTRA